jgi:hypothetical protein
MGDWDLGGNDCYGLQGGREGEGWDLGDWESGTWEATGTTAAGSKLARRDF